MSRPIAYPSLFSDRERLLVNYQLQHLVNFTPYNGDWKADWLLSDIHADVWWLRTKFTRNVNNRWINKCDFSWDMRFFDGSGLLDDCNKEFRIVSQKAAFLIRHLPTFPIQSTSNYRHFLSMFKTVIKWIFMNHTLYEPRTSFFSRLDTDAITNFTYTWVKGGNSTLFHYQEILLKTFYHKALNREPAPELFNNPYNAPLNDRRLIVAWLDRMGFYQTPKRTFNNSGRYIDRAKLSELVNGTATDLNSLKMSAFLRQFEPEKLAKNDRLLLSVTGSSTEYPTHRTLLISEIIQNNEMSSEAAKMFITIFQYLQRLELHLPNKMVNPVQIDYSRAKSIANTGRTRSHTPWVPLKIALAYTSEALRWVVKWGDTLVDFYLNAITTFIEYDWFNENKLNPWKAIKLRNQWVLANMPYQLADLRIGGWSTVFSRNKQQPYDRLRQEPGLTDALHILIGAIVVLIGITKPIRLGELLMLKRDCIYFAKMDGYWLHQLQEKSIINDYLLSTSRPIPTVTAKAIKQIALLGQRTSSLLHNCDSFASTMLFYLPAFEKSGNLTNQMYSGYSLQQSMNRFCDYTALPPDISGRRWYIRSHELRKSFLITFFWSFKYASLDAARWIANHGDANHIYDYIQANFPGDELPSIEAEYASQQLWNYSKSGDKGETENIEDLYSAVCHHFAVSSVNFLQSHILEEWLEENFKSGKIHLQPYSIKSINGHIKTVIAFKFRWKH